MGNLFDVYIIGRYQTICDIGQAVVAAKNEESALSLLEIALLGEKKNDPALFLNRGQITKSDFKSDKEGVIYCTSDNEKYRGSIIWQKD